MGKFWDTVSRLFKKDDEEKQNNSAGTNASAAAAYTEQATQQTQQPVYKDNTIVKVTQPKQNGLYQYKTDTGFQTADEANQQYNYAKSLGYNDQQAFDLIKNGTRWKDVALGENNRPIVSYQGNKYQSAEEANEQYQLALRTGLSGDEALKAMQQGTHWKEQALQLWEDEEYANDAQDKGVLGKATDMLSGITSVTSMQDNYEDAFAERLRKIGYSADEIEAMRERGTLADAAKEIEQSYQQVEDDTFWGQFKANLKLGNLSQQATLMRGRAVLNADEDEMKRADELYRQVAEYAERNKVALDDQNQVASWISKDLANYLPQLVYQSETSALPSMALALVGLLVGGGAGATKGFKTGQVIGSGVYSYATMTGAAYEDLTEKGAEPVAAAHMAKDEALISSAIEMGDEAFDQFLGVWSKLGFGKKAEAELAKTFGKQLAGALKDWAGNTGQEGVEEITQQLVSLANERRLADGHTDGGWKELAAYFIKELVDRVPEMGAAIQDKLEDKFPELLSFWADKETTAEAAELLEAGRGGAVIGGVMGLTGTGLSIAQNRLYSADVNRSLDNVVAYGDQQTLSQLSDEELARTIQQAEALNRQDAVDVLEAEQTRRAENNKAETATTQPESQNTVDTEEDEETRWARYDSAREEEGIESLSTEELKDYAQILQNDIVGLEKNPNSDSALIAEHEEIRSQVIKELSIRQAEEEAAAEAAKEAEKAQPKQEKPAEQPIVNNQQQVYDADTQPMAESAKGAQANDNSVGDRGQDTSDAGGQRRDARYSGEPVTGASTEGQEVRSEQKQSDSSAEDQSAVGTGQAGVQGSGTTGTQDNEVGRGKERRRALRERIFSKDTKGLKERQAAIDKKYDVQSFIDDPNANVQKLNKATDSLCETIGKALGSNKSRGERFVDAWLKDVGNQLRYSVLYGDVVEENNMSAEQANAFLRYQAANEIIAKMAGSNMDAQLVADLLGIDLAKAEGLVKNSQSEAINQLAKAKILDSEGNVRQNKNKIADIIASRKSGRDEKGRVTEGNYEQNEKYVAQPDDKEVNVGAKGDNKVIKRGEEYLIVSKDGYVLGNAGDEDDAYNKAAAIARGSIESYNAASFKLFNKKGEARNIHFKKGTGRLIMEESNLIKKENQILREKSAASDVMEVAYSKDGKRTATDKWFELDLSYEKGDDISGLRNREEILLSLIEGGACKDDSDGILAGNGKKYVFFGMTANGAKKGKCIMVESKYYDSLRKASLSGLTEADELELNPAKYLTASTSIFSPSNNDTGVKVNDCIVLSDVYVAMTDVLRRFMRTDNRLDREALIKSFSKTMTRKLMAQGQSRESAEQYVNEYVPKKVDEIISQNKVGAMVNIMADMMLTVTDGTGFIMSDKGESFQFRGAGGFKGQLIGFDWVSYLNDLVPLDEREENDYHNEYKWYDEDGSVSGGIRHILHNGEDKGVEVRDRWGTWHFINGKKAILFDSAVKFAGQFNTSEEFYSKAGEYDIRSIPRENVYGAGFNPGMLEGYTTKGLAQMLRNVYGFSMDEVRACMSEKIGDVIDNICASKEMQAKMMGYSLDSDKPTSSTDNRAKLMQLGGEEAMDTATVRGWVADKIGEMVDRVREGRMPFADGEANYQWVDPDVIGLAHTMTSIVTVTNGINEQIENVDGGFSYTSESGEEYSGLKKGEIYNAGVNGGETAIGRSPANTRDSLQMRQNARNKDAIFNEMAEKYGLDLGNTYVAINDTLSMYLDNDYDGDPVLCFNDAIKELISDTKKKSGEAHNVIGAGAKLMVNRSRTGDLGPVEFSHDKGEKIKGITIKSDAILACVQRYLTAMKDRNIGTYDMMIDRLSALKDEYLKPAADKAGLSVEDYRALLEARFGVAYVLAIDFAKSGNEFPEFFDLVKQCDQELIQIAIDNKLIPPNSNTFIPQTYEHGRPGKRERFYDKKLPKLKDKGNNLLQAISDVLPQKSKRKLKNGGESYASWYNTFADKFNRYLGATQGNLSELYKAAMTGDVRDYAFGEYTSDFFDRVNQDYRDIVRSGNDQNISDKENINRKKKKVYQLQKKLGLNNEQFTDLMLYILSEYGGSSALILNFDQHQIDPSNTEPSTAQIIGKNLDLLLKMRQASNIISNTEEKIDTLRNAMNTARERVDSLAKEREGIYNAAERQLWETAQNTSIAIEQEIYKLQNRIKSLKDQNKRYFSEEDFNDFRNELSLIDSQIKSLQSRLENVPAMVTEGFSEGIEKAFAGIDKDIRNAWREISNYASALEEIYDAYEDWTAAQERAEGVYGERKEGADSLELSEKEMLSRLGQQPEQQQQEEQAPPPEEEDTPAPEEEPEMPPPPDEPLSESPTPPEAPEPPEPPKPPKQEVKPKAEPKAAAPEQKEEAPKPFGKRRGSIVKSASTIKVSANKYAGVIAGTEDAPIRTKISRKLTSFANAVKDMTAGKKTGADVYAAYSTLDGTQYNSEDVTAYFDEMNDRYEAMRRNTTDETTEAYEKAVDEALAAFAARYKNVERVNSQTAKLTEDAVKSTTDKFFDKAKKFYESWQVKAPTFFKMLCGFKKGSEGYQLARMVNNGYGKKCDLVAAAYKNLERVRNLNGFDKLVNGDIKVHLESVNADISALEAINLSRMLDTVMASDNTLSNVKGFNLADGTHISTITYDEEGRANNIVGTLRNELTRYFNDKASSIEKEYYKAISDVFREFTPEVERVGKQYNGIIDMYSPDWYSPIMWGKGGKGNVENFNAKEAMLKTMPRYMKARSEKAGGSLYIESMDKVIGNYINSMADYLAYADLRNTLAIMNQNAELRTTKTLAEIAGENMGQSFARFANEYVKDMTTTQFDNGGFFEKLRLQMQKGILIGSPSVMIKQSASYWNAASVIDMKYLVSALSEGDLKRYFKGNAAAALEYRKITGNFDPTLTEVFNNSASKNPLVNMFKNGIGKVDYATVKRVYVAACLQVEAQGISHNSAEFEAAVKELFTEAVAETQPVFDTALRAENQRTSNEWVRMASMFRTQQTQNFNALLTACGEYKADPTATNKQAKSKAIKGLVASSVTFAVLSSVADLMLHRLKKYRDRDDEDNDKNKLEITGKNVGKRLAMSSIETAASTLWMGDYMSQYLIDMISNGKTKEFYGVSLGPLSLISDTVTALKDFRTKPSIDGFRKLSMYLTQMGGYPLNNLYNLGNSALMYYLDVTGDNPDKFDDLAKYMDDYLKSDNKMIRAITSGNESRTNELWKELKKQKGDKADDQMRTLVKDQYSKGKLKNEQAENLLIKYGELTKENEAAKRVAKWEFDKAHPEYKDDVTEANVWKWKQTIEPTGVSLKTYVDALKHFKEISKDKENGNDRNDMLVYLSKLGLTEDQMLAMYSSFGQNFYQSFDPTQGAYARYNQYGKPAGISTEDFVKYYEYFNSLTSDKDKNGKTINNSKKKKVIAYINSLSLSKEQKRALWKAFGYTSKAPW